MYRLTYPTGHQSTFIINMSNIKMAINITAMMIEREKEATVRNIDNDRRTVDIPIVNGVMQDIPVESVPNGFTPSKVALTTTVAFNPPADLPAPAPRGYADAAIVYDANGVECHPTREIFSALQISSAKKFSRDEQRLVTSTFRDTGELKYVQGVDYIQVCPSTSVILSQINNVIPDPSNPAPLLDNPNVVQQGNSLHVVSEGGSNGRIDTVWTTAAAKRIALSSNTEAGLLYANSLVNLEQRHGDGNTDILEHLVELSNDTPALPVLPVPDGYARVEDVTSEALATLTHKQSCALGKLAQRVTNASSMQSVKVNSTKYPTAYVNAYPQEVVDGIMRDMGYTKIIK